MKLRILCEEKKKEEKDRMEDKNDEAKIEFQKAVMRKEDEKQEEKLATIQKDMEEAAGKVACSTKYDSDNAMKETPQKARIREEAAARCTKVIKKGVLKKQARKARADHPVNCSSTPGRSTIEESRCQSCVSTGTSRKTESNG